jgi:mannose-6-phosphate isomerase-like protein (cupin superfamily)
MRSAVFHLTETERRIPAPPAQHYDSVMERGTVKVLLSLPVRPNRQTPHEQDELYIIVRGRGVLVHDGTRDAFECGDLMFVAAGTEHWFEDFSDDLAAWVVFYGQRGGELR